MCGIGDESGMNFYAWTVVKTQLMARARSASPERSIHFHIVVDSSMADLVADRPRLLRTHPGIADVVDYIRNNHTTNVQLSLYLISELEAIAGAQVGQDLAAVAGLFRPCSTARLMLPFVPALAAVDKLFYLDADAVVLCDVALLWDGFAWPDGALMAATLEMAHSGQISMYQGMPAAFGGLGLNSGTLLMHLERMRGVGLVHIWREMAEIARAGGYKGLQLGDKLGFAHQADGLAFGDQDLLNILGADDRHPTWFALLDPRYNWRQTTHATRAIDLRINAPPGYVVSVPCIEHYAGRVSG